MRNVTSAEPACRRDVSSVSSFIAESRFVMSAASDGGRCMPRIRRGPMDEVTNRRLLSSMTYQNGSSAVSTGGSERRRLKLSAVRIRVAAVQHRAASFDEKADVLLRQPPRRIVPDAKHVHRHSGSRRAFRCTRFRRYRIELCRWNRRSRHRLHSLDDFCRRHQPRRRTASQVRRDCLRAEMILVPVRDQDRRDVIERRRRRLETPPLLHRRSRIRRNPLANRRVEQELLSIRFEQDACIRDIRDRARSVRLALPFQRPTARSQRHHQSRAPPAPSTPGTAQPHPSAPPAPPGTPYAPPAPLSTTVLTT